MFDERLRRATFDAYVATIGTQFEGLAPAGVTVEDLRVRYAEDAVRSATPAAFYGVLRALLADLDDPHAALRVSPRFWSGPVAEPEWIQFVEVEGRVHAGLPEPSIRTMDEAERARSRWLVEIGAPSLADLDARGIAAFLRASAAFGPRFAGRERARVRALTRPLRWLPLVAIDGREVETPHDAELLVRGALGSIARLRVEDPGGSTAVLGAVRNAGVFEEDEETGGVRRRLHPLELAAELDPDGVVLRGFRPTARAPRSAERARSALSLSSALERGQQLAPHPSFEPFGLEAHLIRTPDWRHVGYLRIASFRARGGSDKEGEPAPSLMEPLEIVTAAFRGVDHWILDVTGNPGGSWAEAGLFMSYFQDPEEAVVPHEVRSTSTRGGFLLTVKTLETHRLRRVDVERVTPRSMHVLVDQDTASAGEIVASFLRGAVDGVLVGERTSGAEFSTGEFEAPDGSVLRIGLGGGMMEPYENFQGRGLTPDVVVRGAPEDLEVWRAAYPLLCLDAALSNIDARERARAKP